MNEEFTLAKLKQANWLEDAKEYALVERASWKTKRRKKDKK